MEIGQCHVKKPGTRDLGVYYSEFPCVWLVIGVTAVKGGLSQRSGACVANRPASPKGCHWIHSFNLVFCVRNFCGLDVFSQFFFSFWWIWHKIILLWSCQLTQLGLDISFDQQMGNWANVGLEHLPKIMWETKAGLKTCARAVHTLLFPSTNSKIHAA